MLTERRTHRLCLNAEADGPAKCPAVAVQASDVAWECIPLLPPAGFTRENADAIVAKLDAMARPTMIQYATSAFAKKATGTGTTGKLPVNYL